MSTLLVTGSTGFIGSNFVHLVRRLRPDRRIVNLDVLPYAGDLANLAALAESPLHVFVKGDITHPLDSALRETIDWYRDHGDWLGIGSRDVSGWVHHHEPSCHRRGPVI